MKSKNNKKYIGLIIKIRAGNFNSSSSDNHRVPDLVFNKTQPFQKFDS